MYVQITDAHGVPVYMHPLVGKQEQRRHQYHGPRAGVDIVVSSDRRAESSQR
jgi:hypothetical protein